MALLAYFTSPSDWAIVALIALVFFGGGKIPELARGLGEGIREFKKSVAHPEPDPPAPPVPAEPRDSQKPV